HRQRAPPAPVPPLTARRPWVTSAASPASGPSRPSTRAARRRGSLQGPGPPPVVRVACRIGLSPMHRLMGTRRTRAHGRGDPRRPDTGGVDTGRPDAGSRTTSPGHWTPGGPDTGRTGHRAGRTLDGPDSRPRTTAPDGWTPMLDADRRPTPWLAFWHVEHGDGACPLDGRWTLGWARASGRSTNQDSRADSTH